MAITGIWGSLIGAGTQVGMGLYNNHYNAKQARASDERGYSYSKRLMRLQDALYRQQLIDSPSLTREGLVKAGYNPMLALGDLTSASMTSSAFGAKQNTSNVALDSESAFRAGKALQELTLKTVEAQKDNIEADTKLKQGQLDAVETQRLQTEANTSLLESQTERSDLQYGRDIADTVIDVVGTGASLYSAKAMADAAKANADSNARNARTNERKLDTTTIENRYDKKGKLTGSSERMTSSSLGESMERHSVNPKSKPNATGKLGGSVKAAAKVAKEVGKLLLPTLPAVYAVDAIVDDYNGEKHIPKHNEKMYKHRPYSWSPLR